MLASLNDFVSTLSPRNDSSWAWSAHKSCVRALARASGARRVLEVGGGRDPLFTHEEVESEGWEYTVNDISAQELSFAPAYVKKACFDIAGTLPAGMEGGFDLIFSKMVAEHVRDGHRMHANVLELLATDGVALHFFPTLYSPPFVLNRLLPESVTSRLLRLFFPRRNSRDIPKFPARYDLCVARPRLAKVLTTTGYRQICIVPFFGHTYFLRIPILRSVDRALTRAASTRDWRSLASFAYLFALK